MYRAALESRAAQLYKMPDVRLLFSVVFKNGRRSAFT